MHTSTTRWQSWITTKLEFGLLCSNFATFFFFSLFTPDILKKFNPNVKGWSKGQGTTNAGFNVAVSGAKISWVFRFKWFTFMFVFVFFCWVLTILFLFCCTEGSRARCDAWLITWKKTLWVQRSVSCSTLIHALMHRFIISECSDPFFVLLRRWILRTTGSWWPSSSEAMTCVSTATTAWVAAWRRHRKFEGDPSDEGLFFFFFPPQHSG